MPYKRYSLTTCDAEYLAEMTIKQIFSQLALLNHRPNMHVIKCGVRL